MGILPFVDLWLSRPLIFRYKVTAGGDGGKRPPAAWPREKNGSLPRFVPNRVFRVFSLATLALRPLCPPS